MVKLIQDELNAIESARVDAREEQEEANYKATSDYHQLLAAIEAENWQWWCIQHGMPYAIDFDHASSSFPVTIKH